VSKTDFSPKLLISSSITISLLLLPKKKTQIGKKSMRFRYTVIEEGNGTDQEKYLEVGKRTSEDIDSFLLEGATRLKVQRFGAGTDTRYHVTSA
jgi:hypothetical protein